MLDKLFYQKIFIFFLTFYFCFSMALRTLAQDASDPDTEAVADETSTQENAKLPTINLQLGQKYPLEGFAAQNIQVSPVNIAEAKTTAQGILLIGRSPGTAILTANVGSKNVQIKIVVRNQTSS